MAFRNAHHNKGVNLMYNNSVSIKDAIDGINKQNYVLPSIQREFVWKTKKIEILFDSLMRNYPIGTFLFWQIDKDELKDFQFYKFLKSYNEHDSHNEKINLEDAGASVEAVLDGQQRLTAFYLGLKGSYIEKKKYIRKSSNNRTGYIKKYLHINLLQESDDAEKKYDFRFLSNDDPLYKNTDFHWFKCHDILNFEEKKFFYYVENNLNNKSSEQRNFAFNTLTHFYNIIDRGDVITYYLEKSKELNNVLQVFIRANSGGIQLSNSDLLLSTVTAIWKEKDAREVIHQFVDEINNIGGVSRFKFNKDVVLKACLVLSDIKDVGFKISNFTVKNMKKIEEEWEEIQSAIYSAVSLISTYGYDGKNLLATNAIIPIAYFIYKHEKYSETIVDSSSRQDDRHAVKKWLARVLLKGIFGGRPDEIYPVMRKLINDNLGKFPLQETIKHYRGNIKSILFTEDEIDRLLDLQYKDKQTWCALTLIYPNLNFHFTHDIDHIHPRFRFSKRMMKNIDLTAAQKKEFDGNKDNIANLQILNSYDNAEKHGKPFEDWINERWSEKSEKESYLRYNHISTNQSLKFEDFSNFITNRRKTLKKEFIQVLGVEVK